MAVDQIAFQLPETNFKEGSAFSLPVYLRNRAAAAAATPTTIHWRLDCVSTQTTVVDWTSVAAASSFTLSITGAHNAIQGEGNAIEVKQVTVKTDDGLSTQYVETVRYRVENLYGSP
jgi:hypothetical protein